MRRLGETGALSIPLGLALMIVSLSGLALWGLLREWRNLAELQLRLDRCVGEVALKLKDDARTIRKTNLEIQAIRAALNLAAEPATRAVLQTALGVEVARQEWVRIRWNARRVSWIVRRGCGQGRDLPWPLAEFPWTRDPPDSLGPRPLRIEREIDVRVQLGHPPRHAAARMTARMTGKMFGEKNETVRWVAPRLF